MQMWIHTRDHISRGAVSAFSGSLISLPSYSLCHCLSRYDSFFGYAFWSPPREVKDILSNVLERNNCKILNVCATAECSSAFTRRKVNVNTKQIALVTKVRDLATKKISRINCTQERSRHSLALRSY